MSVAPKRAAVVAVLVAPDGDGVGSVEKKAENLLLRKLAS